MIRAVLTTAATLAAIVLSAGPAQAQVDVLTCVSDTDVNYSPGRASTCWRPPPARSP